MWFHLAKLVMNIGNAPSKDWRHSFGHVKKKRQKMPSRMQKVKEERTNFLQVHFTYCQESFQVWRHLKAWKQAENMPRKKPLQCRLGRAVGSNKKAMMIVSSSRAPPSAKFCKSWAQGPTCTGGKMPVAVAIVQCKHGEMHVRSSTSARGRPRKRRLRTMKASTGIISKIFQLEQLHLHSLHSLHLHFQTIESSLAKHLEANCTVLCGVLCGSQRLCSCPWSRIYTRLLGGLLRELRRWGRHCKQFCQELFTLQKMAASLGWCGWWDWKVLLTAVMFHRASQISYSMKLANHFNSGEMYSIQFQSSGVFCRCGTTVQQMFVPHQWCTSCQAKRMRCCCRRRWIPRCSASLEGPPSTAPTALILRKPGRAKNVSFRRD